MRLLQSLSAKLGRCGPLSLIRSLGIMVADPTGARKSPHNFQTSSRSVVSCQLPSSCPAELE